MCITTLLFIGYGLGFDFNNCMSSINKEKKSVSKEEKIISYLEKKYNKKFKILKLESEGPDILFPEINCDGSVFFPEIEDEDTYNYYYKVLSTEDNIEYMVLYQENKTGNTIKEHTDYTIEEHPTYNEAINYTIKTLKLNDFSITEAYLIMGDIIEINENFNDLYNETYLKKLKKIAKYMKDSDPTVRLKYADNIGIAIMSDQIALTIGYITYLNIEDYLKNKEVFESTAKYIIDTLNLNSNDLSITGNADNIIIVTIKENFNDVYNKVYNEKIKKISKYVSQKNKIISQLDIEKEYNINTEIEIRLYYKDDMDIYINNKHITCEYNDTFYYSIEEYLKNFKNK